MLAHDIEEIVLEKAESIFLEWSMKILGISSPAPASVPAMIKDLMNLAVSKMLC